MTSLRSISLEEANVRARAWKGAPSQTPILHYKDEWFTYLPADINTRIAAKEMLIITYGLKDIQEHEIPF